MADYGVESPAGPGDPVAESVAAAKAAGMAYVQHIEESTHTAGDSVGDVMPAAPAPPDVDSTVLQALIPPAVPKGL